MSEKVTIKRRDDLNVQDTFLRFEWRISHWFSTDFQPCLPLPPHNKPGKNAMCLYRASIGSWYNGGNSFFSLYIAATWKSDADIKNKRRLFLWFIGEVWIEKVVRQAKKRDKQQLEKACVTWNRCTTKYVRDQLKMFLLLSNLISKLKMTSNGKRWFMMTDILLFLG